MKKLLPAFLALLALSAPAANDGAAVYRPGLVQARIPLGSPLGYKTAYTGVPNLASNLLEVADASWLDRTLGVFKDGFAAEADANPVSGLAWPWNAQDGHGVFAYEGQMFVEAGTAYSFYGRNHNGEALVVDGATLVWQGPRNAWNYAPEIFGAWTPAKSGWVDFNAWLWCFNGSHGPVGDKCKWGLQWNPDGIVPAQTETSDVFALATDTNVWSRFLDPGNGTFFRTATGEKFTTVGASAEAAGGRSFDLSFAGVPTNAQLVAFSGPVDGFHDTNGWRDVSAVLADVPPGDSTTNVTVVLAGDARVLRFRLARFDAASTNGLETFEEWTEMVAVTAEPVVRLDAVSPGWTNVVVSGTLSSFGIGGSSGAVTVEVAAADDTDFEHPVASETLPVVSVVGPFGVELFGLSMDTDYLVRAKAENDKEAVGSSPATAFSTRAPGPASVSVEATLCALFSVDLTATVSDWGGGSWDAEAWIDVSASSNFPAGETQTVSLGALSGATPVSATATASGLEAVHSYFARVRAVNSRGIESVSETLAFSTSDKPIGFPEEATVVAERGKVTASLAPTFVTEGVRYDVTLAMEGIAGTRSWKNQTGFGPFVHTQYSPAGTEVVFVYTIAWTYGTASGTIEVRGQDVAQLADRTIHALPEIDPAVGGLYLRPGDTVEIKSAAGIRVDWQTNAVLSILPTNGVFLLEALEPGAALLYETDLATDNTNNVTGVAIVLPADDPAGGIYVRRKLADFTWTDPAAWEMVAEGPQGYPDAAGAWVYIATPAIAKEGPDRTIQVTEPVTVGNLAVGQLGWIHHGFPKAKSHWSWTFGDNEGLGGAIRFDSGDGSESRILTLGHAYNVSRVQFKVPVSAANDFAVDELWRVQDDIGGWANTWDFGLSFWWPVDFGTNTFRNIRGYLYYYPATKVWSSVECNGCAARGFLQFYGDILGSGTIRLEADSMVGCVQDSVLERELSFTGTWDVANGQNISCYGGSGFTWPGTSLGRSKEMIVRGSWLRAEPLWNGGAFVRNAEEGDNWHMFKGWTNDWRNVLPSKVTLDGGCLYLHPNYLDGGWTQYQNDPDGTRRILYDVETLAIPAGPMGLPSFNKSSANLRYPDQYMTVDELALAPGAVLAFRKSDSTTAVSNEFRIVNEPPCWADPSDGNKQFLPYFFANQQTLSNPQYRGDNPYIITDTAVDNTHLFFRDKETGRVTRETADTAGNGYRRWTKDAGETLADGARFCAMLLGESTTNSFAAGATVANLAGYLDMRKGAALGVPGEDGGATVDFGNEPVRVYVGNWGETGTVGCKLAGTAGLVKGGSGILALAASADGVEGGVRVAGGTLLVGATDAEGKLVPGRIGGDVSVEAGSRLVLCDTGSIAPKSKLYLNDRDWIPSFAHVRLEEGAKAVVKEIFVCGEALPHGWYGSSDSAAKHVDDVHFEGPGMIHAGSFPTMMILR